MLGYDFHRQKPIDNYIVDFFCAELMLAVEIVGNSHDSDKVYAKDIVREQKLQSLRIHFLRLDDKEITGLVRSVSSNDWVCALFFLL